MQQEAVYFSVLGLRFYAYGLFLSAGALAGGLLLFFLSRRDQQTRNALPFSCLSALFFGLIFSRTLYCLSDINFQMVASFQNALRLGTGGLSMFGALLGAILGLMIASRLLKIRLLPLLDLFSPALTAFVFFARLGEQYTTLGISRPLVTGLFDHSFLAFQGDYDVYLKTWMLEAIVALILTACLLRWFKKTKVQGNVFLTFMLLFGGSQVLMESLRYDGHMRFSFIGLQQILAACLLGVALILLYIKAKNAGKRAPLWVPVLTLSAVVAAIIGLEFLIDRSQINKLLLYVLYILILCIPCVLGLIQKNRSETNG